MLYSCFLFLTINFPIGVWVIMQWRGSRVTLFSVSKHTFIGVQVTSIGLRLEDVHLHRGKRVVTPKNVTRGTFTDLAERHTEPT